MNWHKSGYKDKFTDQQMIIMERRRQEEERRRRKSEEKRSLNYEKAIIGLLTERKEALSLQEISNEIGISDREALEILNKSKVINKIVAPLNGADTSITYTVNTI